MACHANLFCYCMHVCKWICMHCTHICELIILGLGNGWPNGNLLWLPCLCYIWVIYECEHHLHVVRGMIEVTKLKNIFISPTTAPTQFVKLVLPCSNVSHHWWGLVGRQSPLCLWYWRCCAHLSKVEQRDQYCSTPHSRMAGFSGMKTKDKNQEIN